MAASEKDVTPMLSGTYLQVDECEDSQLRKFVSTTRSASISIPMDSVESYGHENNLVGHTGPLRSERKIPLIQMSGPLYIGRKHENLFRPTKGATGHKSIESTVEKYPSFRGMDHNNSPDNYAGKNEHLLRSGQLGICNDPYCTRCPAYYNFNEHQKNSNSSVILDPKFHTILYGDAKGWARRTFSFLHPSIPGVMNPHTRVVQQWNKFFVISCLVAIFLDPLFFLLLSVQQDNKCIVINWTMTTVLVVFRSMTDFIYLLHMLLQFRLAYIAPESRVVGAGDLVDHPKKIALNYLSGYFLVDVFVVLPLPQIIVLLVLPRFYGSSGANYAKNLLRAAVLFQYIPRLYRSLPFLVGQSPSGFIFESAGANFVINLLSFVLSGHVVGSCWYLFGLQRVNQCLRDACHTSGIPMCKKFIDCGHGDDNSEFERNAENWNDWKNNANASACLLPDDFAYGIYAQVVNLTTKHNVITRYTYSLFWGFQQISTLAGNLVPSYFVWEVLFTMGIIGLGLLLFALLIGNIQNFLQALGRSQVRESERYNWAATRGVNEEMLLVNLPEDLQREIRRHLFKFVKKVRIFAMMDEPILDAICERLRQKTYIKGSKILYPGGLIEKMVFIVRGKMESIGEDGTIPLFEGDVCGEELLRWFLEYSSVYKDERNIRIPRHKLLSNRMVRCLTNVEAFTLQAADLEDVTSLFARFLRIPRVQGAMRYESPYWRGVAAARIQVAWRYRKKRLNRENTSNSQSNYS
ncbi:probable cyclic nucleotide-gated ion channel 20, chloroplastic isoform X2 [Cornus florida]|uniref:probable cyclic nucleotide-gated ion channel 20, chloroplastic isoform X2 n=1 Tax=Cornus florida TaxID=4283 RepID=UPI00289C19D4|nr:probable cyclic nucleotide-gated ion channel 20, chloroplastic isoform X2 [Cornus florida]